MAATHDLALAVYAAANALNDAIDAAGNKGLTIDLRLYFFGKNLTTPRITCEVFKHIPPLEKDTP